MVNKANENHAVSGDIARAFIMKKSDMKSKNDETSIRLVSKSSRKHELGLGLILFSSSVYFYMSEYDYFIFLSRTDFIFLN